MTNDNPKALTKVSLDDKYALDTTRAYMTGIEALVRLPMLQQQRDRRAGLNTAGFITGGSVLAGLSVASMIGMRAYFWEVTPRCSNYACVQACQNMAPLTMSGLALSTSVGAALIGYGRGYRRQRRLMEPEMMLLPQTGRGFAGLTLRGQF